MEFEEVVAQQLKTLGYPIFYRNYKIMYHRTDLTEFDIVSNGFVVEVKSGKSTQARGLHALKSFNILPEPFRYYIYCPALDDDEIACLNEYRGCDQIMYINSYKLILQNHPPRRDCVFPSEGAFATFLNMPLRVINEFNTLYIRPLDYNIIMWRIQRYRDRYSYTDNMSWSDKIYYLLKVKRLVVTQTLPQDIAPYFKHKNPSKTLMLNQLQRFPLPLYYDAHKFEKDKQMTDLYL
jgi:hypothetical protein